MKYTFPVITDIDMFLKTDNFIIQYSKYRNITPAELNIELMENTYEDTIFSRFYNKLESYVYKRILNYTVHKSDFENVLCSKIDSDLFPVKGFYIGLIQSNVEKSRIKEVLTQLTYLILERQISVKGEYLEEILDIELNEEEKNQYFFVESTDYIYKD